MFGFRAELFATGFAKTINDWCIAHGIKLTGHVDQEEIVNPTGLCGDLMKAFKYQGIPGIDQIFQYGRASKAYKIVSSAADNYDRPLVMSETFGAIEKLPPEGLYKEAMDQYAKGINLLVPHAVWYDPNGVVFPQELSYRHPVYGRVLAEFNRYMGRLNRLLQSGRPVVDIAVLYPIATLQGGYRFGVGKPYEGGVIPEEADYMDVGELLSLAVRRDYTFLHPEVLEEKCSVGEGTLSLHNANLPQTYRVMILPGSKTISVGSLDKIRRFYERGGKVIATTRLPHRSAEFGKDQQVCDAVRSVFQVDPLRAVPSETIAARTNPRGGKAIFVAHPTAASLRQALDEALDVYDVQAEAAWPLTGGKFSYIHKVQQGRDVYFFANSSDTTIDTHVRIRGKKSLESWDPHTGKTTAAQTTVGIEQGHEVSRVHLVLGPVRSAFLVANP